MCERLGYIVNLAIKELYRALITPTAAVLDQKVTAEYEHVRQMEHPELVLSSLLTVYDPVVLGVFFILVLQKLDYDTYRDFGLFSSFRHELNLHAWKCAA